MKKLAGLLLCVPMLMGADSSGCSTVSTPQVQPVTIGVSEFCETMKAILPPNGKPTWDVADSVPTITQSRRVGAAVDARCGKPIEVATATKRGTK